MILIISSHKDDHAAAVRRELELQQRSAELLDLSEFPQRLRLNLRYQPQRDFSLTLADGRSLPLAECRSIWWRRPQPFMLDPAVRRPSFQTFALNEAHEAFSGLWQSLDARWMNHPTRDEVAARKAYQLRIAHEVGLRIPDTLITNDPEQARAFAAAHGVERTIYKPFSATEQEWRETRMLRTEECTLLDEVRHAPVIFQSYVEAVLDLRVTIVGHRVFATAIHSQDSAYRVDCRMDLANARVDATRLPAEVEERLLRLMARLGLVYGAIDLRLTPNAEYVFLEINPAGQWLFMEERSGQPITQAVATELAAQDVP